MLGFMFVLHIGGDEENRTPVREWISYEKMSKIMAYYGELLECYYLDTKYFVFSLIRTKLIKKTSLQQVDRTQTFRYNL